MKKTIKIAIAIAILAGLAGIGVGVVASVHPELIAGLLGISVGGDVQGSFEASGGELGNWKFTPDSCASGEPRGFFGVLLYNKGDNDHVIKVFKQPDSGKIVLAVKIPGSDKARILQSCKRLEDSVHRTSTRFNKVWEMAGQIDIDCPAEHFRGRATFDHCH